MNKRVRESNQVPASPKTAKRTLKSLPRGLPEGEDRVALFKELVSQTDRGAALNAGELVSVMLRKAIEAGAPDDVEFDKVFEGPNAPVGSFSARTLVAHLMGIIDTDTRNQLNVIRGIRNHFAHSLLPHDFSEPAVEVECNKLHPAEGVEGADKLHPMRWRYTWACLLITGKLAEKGGTRMDEKQGKALSNAIRGSSPEKD